MQEDLDLSEKEQEILIYCARHLEFMWAAVVVSIILDCDFRDCREAFMLAKDNPAYPNLKLAYDLFEAK